MTLLSGIYFLTEEVFGWTKQKLASHSEKGSSNIFVLTEKLPAVRLWFAGEVVALSKITKVRLLNNFKTDT